MPKIARFQMPDGKIGRFEVPDDATPEQAQTLIAQSLQPQTIISESSPPTESPVRVVGQLGIHSRSGIVLPQGDTLEELGGRVTDATGSPLLGTMARMAPDVATSFLGMGAGKLASPAMAQKGIDLMQSAIKPTAGQLARGQGQKAVQTALEEGISVGKGGMEKLRSLIEPIDSSIEAKLASSTASAPISSFSPAFNEALQSARFSPPQESAAIAKAIADFEDKFYPGGGALPVQDIQKIKQAYYRALGPESYGVLTSGERTGMKAVARGAKDAVAENVPGIAEENAKLSPLLNALNVIERRVELTPNKDVGGLAWLAHGLKTGILMLAARDPYTKSLLARGLYSGADIIPPALGGISGATVPALYQGLQNK